jgi:hypothetical protein
MPLDGVEPGARDGNWRWQFADHGPELRVRGSELYGSLPHSLARRRGPKRGGRNRSDPIGAQPDVADYWFSHGRTPPTGFARALGSVSARSARRRGRACRF